MRLRLDIGCSHHKLPGWIGLDLDPGPQVDVVADMAALPFADSTVDQIHSRHTLEHVPDPLACIRELHRVLKPGGEIRIIVPHYSNHAYWADMTHRRPFSVRSFEYFDRDYAEAAGFPVYLPDVNLKMKSARLVYWPRRIYERKTWFKRWPLALLNAIFSGLANLNPFLCERFWCGWVGGFYEVDFIMTKRERNGND